MIQVQPFMQTYQHPAAPHCAGALSRAGGSLPARLLRLRQAWKAEAEGWMRRRGTSATSSHAWFGEARASAYSELVRLREADSGDRILFVFHKNGHLSCKAKVQPPRLNGAKTGVFSTRSPHRPNAIGLTLAKLEKVEGGAIYLSGIDMIHGTPILDIKPYIAEYDSPQNVMEPLADFNLQNNQHKPKTVSQSDSKTDSCDQRQLSGCDEPQPHHGTKEKPKCPEDRTSEENCLTYSDTAQSQQAFPMHREITADFGLESRSDQSSSVAEEQIGPYCPEKSFLEEGTDKKLERVEGAAVLQGSRVETQPRAPHYPAGRADGAPHSMVPAWVREAPVATLEVRFTPHAEMDLVRLSSQGEPVETGFHHISQDGLDLLTS
uniref:tRNA (adenine(37)-N6)-methyltransferase isoform X3 n=1 Tax=Callithrix jacchus TaxID=9483 RepID=UPI0023DD2D76|nr:tRNA (adenine(37)-N6)-methyltransferase isoform X3 [Callithrix jacchus]